MDELRHELEKTLMQELHQVVIRNRSRPYQQLDSSLRIDDTYNSPEGRVPAGHEYLHINIFSRRERWKISEDWLLKDLARVLRICDEFNPKLPIEGVRYLCGTPDRVTGWWNVGDRFCTAYLIPRDAPRELANLAVKDGEIAPGIWLDLHRVDTPMWWYRIRYWLAEPMYLYLRLRQKH